MKLKLACVAISALLLGSCAKDVLVEVPTKAESVSLLLSATSAGTVIITKGGVETPVALPIDVSTGIYVAKKDVADAYLYSNQNFTAKTAGVLSPADKVDPVSLTVDSDYDIYAYAPFKANVESANAIPVSHGDDVLWAPKASIIKVTKENCTAALAFEHRGARISFAVKFASDFTAGNKEFTADSKIEVSGFYNDGVFHLPSGLVTPLTIGTTLSAVGVGAPVTLSIPLTNFLPKTVAMPLTVKVTHEGKTYTGNISTVFATGTSNEYTITLKGRSPDLGVNATVNPWTVVPGNVDVTESN